MLRKSGAGCKRWRKLEGLRFSSYSSKVRAYPFVISQEQAIQEMSVHMAILTVNKPIRTYLRRWFPSMNIDALRPTRIQPVYLPTWLIDAQVQATLWLKETNQQSEFRKDDAGVQFAHSCMPGFVYRPLHECCLVTTDLLKTQPVQWSEDMQRHDGGDVLCLPFTISPFRLTEAARRLSFADANVSDIVRFEPSSLRETMMAAYPVLVPIWLAQFVVKAPVYPDGARQDVVLTAFIEAGRSKPRVYIEMLPILRIFLGALGLGDGPGLLIQGSPIEYPPHFTNVRSIIGNHATREHRKHIAIWIDLALCATRALAKYEEEYFASGKGVVNWEDVRIRPFSLEERAANLRWLGSAEDMFVLQKVLEFYEQKHESTSGLVAKTSSDPSGKAGPTEDQIRSTQDKIDALQKEREKQKPEWLVQYEIQQRLLSETSSTDSENRQ